MKNKTSKRNAPIRNARPKRRATQFGAVSTISTAPVAIGNSVRGSKPVIINSANGCRVIGRDFAFECKSTVAAATNWSLIGGMPLTPAVLNVSSLRSYTQLFANFKINKLAVHYITSSPTSQAGDVLFYYERERNGPMIDCTSNSFLPFVLSDPSTIIGPQWQNHTMLVDPVKEWKNTNYGLSDDLNEESAGSVFLYSKTNSANSPGYILIDFDITFKEMCVNPRAGILPISRGLWNYWTFGVTSTAVTAGGGITGATLGNNPDGTASTLPNGTAIGDIFKVVFQITNSTVSGVNAAWTLATTANLFEYYPSSTAVATTVDDGFTCWGSSYGTGMYLHPSLELAKTFTSGTSTLKYGITGTIAYNVCTLVSFVGSQNSNLQSSY